MKELTTEQKAQRYDEAIEKARCYYKGANGNEDMITMTTTMFPELKESENEDILKGLISMCKTLGKTKWIAWLEKQDIINSQLPTFTFDDVLALQCCMETVKKVQEDKELYRQLQSLHSRLYDAYWIEKQGEQKSIWHNEDEEPQRDSLILLIMQSGTPIVAKIIEPNHTFNHGERWAYIDDLLEKQGKQKDIPADAVLDGNKDGLIDDTIRCKTEKQEWSEEDENLLKLSIENLTELKDRFGEEYGKVGDCIVWHESLKDRVGCEVNCATTKEWSEEDKVMLDEIVDFFENGTVKLQHDLSLYASWLKSIKDRVQSQPSQEWSEEDRITRNALIKLVEKLYESSIYELDKNRLLDWLKSIRPQSAWKPSDKQIYSLDRALRFYGKGTAVYDSVKELLEQLKKLKD